MSQFHLFSCIFHYSSLLFPICLYFFYFSPPFCYFFRFFFLVLSGSYRGTLKSAEILCFYLLYGVQNHFTGLESVFRIGIVSQVRGQFFPRGLLYPALWFALWSALCPDRVPRKKIGVVSSSELVIILYLSGFQCPFSCRSAIFMWCFKRDR